MNNHREQEPTVSEVLRATDITTDACMIEADLTGRIQAVQRAEVIGWEPGALIGQTLEALVPERFREAHRAGFARMLATGDSLVAGATLNVPALDQTGAESPMRLSVARLGDTFIGTLMPLTRESADVMAAKVAQAAALLEEVSAFSRDQSRGIVGLKERAHAAQTRIAWLFTGGLMLAAIIVALVITVFRAETSANQTEALTRRIDRELVVQQRDVLCPLYKVFLDSDTPAARERALRERGPNGVAERDRSFQVIRDGYNALKCAPQMLEPKGPQR